MLTISWGSILFRFCSDLLVSIAKEIARKRSPVVPKQTQQPSSEHSERQKWRFRKLFLQGRKQFGKSESLHFDFRFLFDSFQHISNSNVTNNVCCFKRVLIMCIILTVLSYTDYKTVNFFIETSNTLVNLEFFLFVNLTVLFNKLPLLNEWTH